MFSQIFSEKVELILLLSHAPVLWYTNGTYFQPSQLGRIELGNKAWSFPFLHPITCKFMSQDFVLLTSLC